VNLKKKKQGEASQKYPPDGSWGEYYENRARHFDNPWVINEYVTPEGKVDCEIVKAMSGFVIEHLLPEPANTFMEVGCGCGVMLSNLWQKGMLGLEVQGIDVSPTMIEKAKKMVPQAKLTVLDAASVGRLNKQFDRILLWGVLHYLDSHKYVASTLKAVIRILKPSGTILLGWIPDSAMKAEYLLWRRSLKSVATELSSPKKPSLQWLWFEKEYFKSLDKRYPIRVEILDHHHIPIEINRFFFSVLIKKLSKD